MAEPFYPWMDESTMNVSERSARFSAELPEAPSQARIAVLDSIDAAPRIVTVAPQPVRAYVDELTQITYSLAKEQGGALPFTVIREIVENLIHAGFREPVVTIWPGGNTIRFADRGPGIAAKEQALEFGTTTATEEMKRYIRGVGFGLPYASHFMDEHGGRLTVADNLSGGTVVTLDLAPAPETQAQETLAGSAPAAASGTAAPSLPTLTAEERDAVRYLAHNTFGGPKELTETFGESAPTWSRRLSELERKGIVEKVGRKRRLTVRGAQISELLAGVS